MKIYKNIDADISRQIDRNEFQDLAVRVLNLNLSPTALNQKYDEIDEDKNGMLSMKEFIKYFLGVLQENDNKSNDEYKKFGMNPAMENENSIETALLMYESANSLKR